MGTQFGNGVMMGGQQFLPHSALGFGGFSIFAHVGFFILAAIVVAIVIWAITRKHGHTSTSGTPATAQAASAEDAALAIARERLARGEIDPGQYTAIVAALSGQPLTTPPAG